ncbi:helix-turn-helix domain-containing protein (plasmid) [Rhodococcus sp. LW-XY12]|nr:helix-turn-helix domain-containing protein [Rhodococcus sp. LW-XY12]
MSRNGSARRIGNVIRDLRRTLGLSRRHLAELSGAHVQTIGALERGDQRPSLDLAMRISAAFDRTAHCDERHQPSGGRGPEPQLHREFRHVGGEHVERITASREAEADQPELRIFQCLMKAGCSERRNGSLLRFQSHIAGAIPGAEPDDRNDDGEHHTAEDREGGLPSERGDQDSCERK